MKGKVDPSITGNAESRGDGNAESRGDGCAEMAGDGNAKTEGDGSVKKEGDCNVKLGVSAGELKRVDGGSDGGSIWDDLEPDGGIRLGTGTVPDHVLVPYGKYRGFFGDSAASVCACRCTSNDWFGQVLRWLMHVLPAYRVNPPGPSLDRGLVHTKKTQS